MLLNEDGEEGSQLSVIETFEPWLQPRRLKIAHGGRGGGKTENIVRLLVLMTTQKKIRVLCAREILKSIEESVHFLIAEVIQTCGLGPYFNIMNRKIVCKTTGSEFLFAGLRGNVNNLKSMGKINILWLEEAEELTLDTWQRLNPTIRAGNSEVWMSFNPEDENSLVWQMVQQPKPHMLITEVQYYDNPYFPKELEQMRQDAEADPEQRQYYEWIWLGKPYSNNDDRVYANKWGVSNAPIEPQPDWSGPYYGIDFGYSPHPSAMIECFVHNDTLYITNEYLAYKLDIDAMPAAFTRAMPHAKSYTVWADIAPANISYLSRNGFPKIRAAHKPNGSVLIGITRIRGFKRIIVAKHCIHTQDEFKSYCWKRDRFGNVIEGEPADEHNHLMDAMRYALATIIFNPKRLASLAKKKRAVSIMCRGV